AGVQPRLELLRNLTQRRRRPGQHGRLARLGRRLQNRFGRAECGEQRARGFAADAGRLEQAQPRRKLVAIDHVSAWAARRRESPRATHAGSRFGAARGGPRCSRVYGWVKRSPRATGSFTDRISAYDMRLKTRNTNRTP